MYIVLGMKLGDSTKGQIGVPETMITSAVSGVIYALFAGQPLIITGKYKVLLNCKMFTCSMWLLS